MMVEGCRRKGGRGKDGILFFSTALIFVCLFILAFFVCLPLVCACCVVRRRAIRSCLVGAMLRHMMAHTGDRWACAVCFCGPFVEEGRGDDVYLIAL